TDVTEYWLSILIFFPLASAAVLAVMPEEAEKLIKRFAVAASLAEMAFSLPLWWRFQIHESGWQFVEQRNWIPALGASYHLGGDGISVLLVLLTTVITAIAVIGSLSAVEKRTREFYALVLALEAG